MKLGFWSSLFFVVLIMMQLGSNLKQGELSGEIKPGEINMSESLASVQWNSTYYDDAIFELKEQEIEFPQSTYFNKIIQKTIDWFGFVSFETLKSAALYGYDNPRHYLWLVYFLIGLLFFQPIFVLIVLIILSLRWAYLKLGKVRK